MSIYYTSKLNFRGIAALLVGICILFLLIVDVFILAPQNGQIFFQLSYFQWSVLISRTCQLVSIIIVCLLENAKIQNIFKDSIFCFNSEQFWIY